MFHIFNRTKNSDVQSCLTSSVYVVLTSVASLLLVIVIEQLTWKSLTFLAPISTRILCRSPSVVEGFHLLRTPAVGATLSQLRNFEHFSFTSSLPRYINRIIENGPPKRKKKKLGPTEGRPFLKGVVLKTLIKKPKKPNSANRKCVRVRLSTGREATAYVPGIGHNLQEHHIVLVRGGRMQDLPGVKLKCVRGKYDLAHVKKA